MNTGLKEAYRDSKQVDVFCTGIGSAPLPVITVFVSKWHGTCFLYVAWRTDFTNLMRLARLSYTLWEDPSYSTSNGGIAPSDHTQKWERTLIMTCLHYLAENRLNVCGCPCVPSTFSPHGVFFFVSVVLPLEWFSNVFLFLFSVFLEVRYVSLKSVNAQIKKNGKICVTYVITAI